MYHRADQRVREKPVALVNVVEQPVMGINIVDVVNANKKSMYVETLLKMCNATVSMRWRRGGNGQ